MRFLSYKKPDGQETWGALDGHRVTDLKHQAPNLREAIATSQLAASAKAQAVSYALDDISFLPVIGDPPKIICVAGNYEAHLKEAGFTTPPKPRIFTRFSNSQVAHSQAMVRPTVSEQFDYEGELAVIIKKAGRHISKSEAMSYVAGYSCYNDGSIRDWQSHSTQYTAGKNFWRTGAFGPWMVTPDEAGDINKWSMATRLNGEEVQKTSIGDMVLDVAALIAYCSVFTPLEPGDVIVTGTPSGVGLFHKPPLWMKHGDTVEVEISGIGILRNPIVDEVSDVSKCETKVGT